MNNPVPTVDRSRRRPRSGPARSLVARGEPMVWLTGGSLAVCLVMIAGLLALILWQGGRAFWPGRLTQVETVTGGTVLGEIVESETVPLRAARLSAMPEPLREAAAATLGGDERVEVRRRLFRVDNRDLTGESFLWVPDYAVVPGSETQPEWAAVAERLTERRFVGTPRRFTLTLPKGAAGAAGSSLTLRAGGADLANVDDGAVRATWAGPAAAWRAFEAYHPDARDGYAERRRLERESGRLNRRTNEARLDLRAAELRTGGRALTLADRINSARAAAELAGDADPAAADRVADAERESSELPDELRAAVESYLSTAAAVRAEDAVLLDRIAELRAAERRAVLVAESSGGREVELVAAEVVRAYPANRLSFLGRLGVYLSRWWEFISEDPRQGNSEGGVFPALWGTVTMTLVMTVFVVPFGVLAALYLREYAKQGWVVSAVRIAVNNLAGVPSIVFGVFGLGFFCYTVGVGIDQLFYAERLPDPTFGKGGLLWASLTLALLTLPVVIVATEEALSAVPNSMRDGSYACGASRWQTIRRIVLPRALPGILTGTILAVARGAGEVAPLMLVGAVNSANDLPVDDEAPFVHPSRSFMHLGFHIYDVGFQSEDGDAARPLVFTTTLLLIGLVAGLNLAAMWLRARLRRRFTGSQF